jgi:hypothetical protein
MLVTVSVALFTQSIGLIWQTGQEPCCVMIARQIVLIQVYFQMNRIFIQSIKLNSTDIWASEDEALSGNDEYAYCVIH